MIDEPTEEIASLYALDLLEGAELAAFEERLRSEPALRELIEELQSAAAALVHTTPSRALPPDLERRVRRAVLRTANPSAVSRANWIPWAIAASLLTACVLLAVDRTRMRERVTQLEQRDFFAQTQIAILSSQLDSAPKARAVVVWDPQKQEGVLKVVDAPVTAADHDYQLWVVDPRYKQPVDAGVFGVQPDGATKITFRPKAKIDSIKGFAVSLERKGGVEKAEGPMVLVGK